MGEIAINRIDYRMVHGQVAVGIIKRFGITSVYVVDGEVVKDETLIDIMTFGMQPGVSLRVCTVEECVKAYQENGFGKGKHLIIFREIESASRAYQKGYRFQSLNIGQSQLTSERIRVHKSISISRGELEMLEELEKAGVKVYFQPLPDDSMATVAEVAKKFE